MQKKSCVICDKFRSQPGQKASSLQPVSYLYCTLTNDVVKSYVTWSPSPNQMDIQEDDEEILLSVPLSHILELI